MIKTILIIVMAIVILLLGNYIKQIAKERELEMKKHIEILRVTSDELTKAAKTIGELRAEYDGLMRKFVDITHDYNVYVKRENNK